VVNVGVGSVEVAALKMAKKDGCQVVFGGIGSEEIFAGYQRHKEADNKQEECWNGLLGMHKRDLQRDFKIFSSFNIIAATPFLDENLIENFNECF
jgi:asparagine synthetase B (glutamine-hydrolysing)